MFCWLFRLMISHAADGDNRLNQAAEKHIRHCVDCRDFYSTCLSLGEQLKSENEIPDRNLSARLRKSVLIAISHQQTKKVRFGVKWWPVAAAACLILTVLIGTMFITKRINDRLTAISNVQTDIQNLRTIVGKEFPTTLPELIEGPLASEAKNLADNTEAAVRFLVACVAVDVTGPENESIN